MHGLHCLEHTYPTIIPVCACIREKHRPRKARLMADHVGFHHTKGSIITDIDPCVVVEYSHDSRYSGITDLVNIQEQWAIALCCRRHKIHEWEL